MDLLAMDPPARRSTTGIWRGGTRRSACAVFFVPKKDFLGRYTRSPRLSSRGGPPTHPMGTLRGGVG